MQSESVPCGAVASTPQDLHSAVVALKWSTDAGRDSLGKEPSRLRIILSAFARAMANEDASLTASGSAAVQKRQLGTHDSGSRLACPGFP